MTDAINMQPEDKGGIGMVLPSQYLLYLHSKRYVQWMRSPDILTGAQLSSFEEWKGDQLQDSISRRHANWAKEPVQKSGGKSGRTWPGMATAAKAYGELRSKMAGLSDPKESATLLPLWNTAIFQRATGPTYQCPALIRKGVLQVGDLLKHGGLDEEKLKPLGGNVAGPVQGRGAMPHDARPWAAGGPTESRSRSAGAGQLEAQPPGHGLG